ncbi:MAG: hypothetical protein A2017_00365 [Lentisphaerae bacterium GWF2_44_16]|nr:MAG: hypothetical protein A2017_00365 [Lentisphaerae bacterium GWF2_44_16]
MNGLLLHCGSKNVDRDDLKYIETPHGTASWKPVPHYEVAELVRGEAMERGYDITSEEYGLNPSGTKMFGVLRFQPHGHPEYARALGFRNSHDKSLALGITAGLTVFVCDNLAFGGAMTIHRKHTSGIEVESLIPDAFGRLSEQYIRLERNVDTLKVMSVSIDEARVITVKAAEIKAIPPSDILSVLKGFREPQHEEFKPCNMWGLYNSFTETAKKYSPPRADFAYRKLAGLFGLDK